VITSEDVIKIAKLSMLEIGEDELESYREELDSIVAFADTIAQAEIPALTGEEDFSLPRYREDTARPSDTQEDVLRNASNPDFGYFAVQKQG